MVRPTGCDVEPAISTKVVPRFDGTGDGYCWLIQLDRYFGPTLGFVKKEKWDG
ncbi:hypothetical protein A2U01_0075236 [Trifolium medium]|uniref:Uncharacterized protein n=1 Tax=Trifolium medium TaxID=97028 RepID=A0A392SZ62_9FABA|nr:hypothetical protein [Trifolium medium]